MGKNLNAQREAIKRLDHLKRDLKWMSKLSKDDFFRLEANRELKVYVEDITFILSLLKEPTKTKKKKELANAV